MKNKVFKLLTGTLVFLLLFIVKLSYVNAACSISVSANSSVVVGNTFKVTATVSSDVGSWYYVLSYDPSKVQLLSGTPKVVGVIGDSKTNTYTFKALKSGVAKFSASNVSLASNSTNQQCSASAGSASVTMKTQAEIEESYSRNNNLSSLSVEGATLTPNFSSSVTQYAASLPVDTTKAKILATAQDKTASITGAGEVDVVDGLNKIEITVTAQHGEKKVYTIDLTVEQLDPIEVKVNNKKYYIVRKAGQIENIPVGFSQTKITVEDQEVVAYKSDIAKLTLLALKDDEGNIGLFIYDEKSKEFSSFDEVEGASTSLVILNDKKSCPDGFVKTSFKNKDKSITACKVKEDENNNFYLVYAKNLETGNEDFYLYDKKDNTYQRYYDTFITLKNEKIEELNKIIRAFIGLVIIVILFKILKGLFTSKKRRIRKLEKKLNKLKSNIQEEDSLNIKKIKDDEYILPKKTRKEKLQELDALKKKSDSEKQRYRRVSLEDDD